MNRLKMIGAALWRYARRWWRRLLGAGVGGLLALVGGFWGLDRAYPFPVARWQQAQAGGATILLDQAGRMIAWRVDRAGAWRMPVALEAVSPWLITATIAAEDKRFWSHAGVDPIAIGRAVGQNICSLRRISGASTVTMQSMRLLWPRPRTWRSKAVETFRAIQAERTIGKHGVLAAYMNLAPYGGNVIGAEAAARRYFAKPAAALSLGEAALLAGIPQRPARFNPVKHLAAAKRRRDYVLRRMQTLGFVDAEAIVAALREPIILARHARTTTAPHLADLFLVLPNQQNHSGTLRTTIDPGVQRIVTETLAQHSNRLQGEGIDGAAAVVIDIAKSSLAALVGGTHTDNPQTGFINNAITQRQPGSLLKPFIYARAYDDGLLTPAELVYDVPSTWQDYQPENIDHTYLGAISAQRALRESRNLPAVRLLARIGLRTFLRDGQRAGLRFPANAESGGLALALGVTETRLLDIANAYAVLARGGRFHALRLRVDMPLDNRRRVYSPAAAYLTLRSLGASESDRAYRATWKTGTSWNHRDAWAVILTPQHVIAVWCGRVSGRGHASLLGAEAALPIAFTILEHLKTTSLRSWKRPPSVQVRKSCALSGARLGRACEAVRETEIIAGVSSPSVCRRHQFRRQDGQMTAIVSWPAEVAAALQAAAQESSGKTISTLNSVPRMRILNPIPGAEYVLATRGLQAGNTLRCEVKTGASGTPIYWFLNGKFLTQNLSDSPLQLPLTLGRHTLTAATEQSRASVTFRVVSQPRR